MEREYIDLKRLTNEEDEAIAVALADTLCQDNVEKFLQLYDEIPAIVSPKRLSNIKEMARQLAALTRTPTYRHVPMPGKDSTYFGINHPLQTSQLTLGNGSLGLTDFSAFKTPPEGCTPIDSKQFDYEEETLKTLGVDTKNLSFGALLDGNGQLNDFGILQTDGLSNIPNLGETLKNEKHCKMYDVDVTKTDDDAFHTPPEFQDDDADPPFGYPPSDKLITSAINLLSKMSTENLDSETKDAYSMDDTKEITSQKEGESHLIEELTCSSNEKDSLDGSPSSRNSFVQEEEDSGISTVEENDISQDSLIAMDDHDGCGDGKLKDKSSQRVYPKSPTTSEKRTCSSPPEPKFACSNFHDTEEAGVGWQTRYKRIGRKPNLKNDRRSNTCDKESYGQNGRNDSRDVPQRVFRGGKIKERNITKVEKFKRNGNRYPDDSERNRDINGWTNKKSEDDEIFEHSSAAYMKRPSRRGGSLPYGGKKNEGRWPKNSSREKHSEAESTGSRQEHALGHNSSGTSQSSVFSYRDALLKANSKGSNSKDGSEQRIVSFKAERAVFDLHLAASYLSSEWTNVTNLYKKDPSKVFFYSDH